MWEFCEAEGLHRPAGGGTKIMDLDTAPLSAGHKSC